jgi:hypothetical protein
MLQDAEKKKVIKSISDLKRVVTAADVSTHTGLPVLLASQALNQIASETGGHLAVSTTGDVVYSFAPGFSNAYITHGVRRILEKTSEKVFKAAFFLLKISFGIMLIISFFIIVMTVVILFLSQKSQDRNNNNTRGRGPRFTYIDYMILRDWFAFLFRLQQQQRVTYDYNRPSVVKREKANFLLDCFSFLFGDGNPNEGLDEKRWQLIAKVIKQHHNVITAEQLAPYTGADPKNEDAVLPVLVRFNGKPQVTETGNIIYTFPALAVTGGKEHLDPAPPFLREFKWKFTEVDPVNLKPVYLIAASNFLGSWLLFLLLHSSHAPSTTALFTAMAAYGTLFVLVPLVRFFVIKHLNKGVDQRNAQRAAHAELLLSPAPELRKKIAESRDYRMRDQLIEKSNAVYTTEKASLDQEDELERHFNKPGETFDARPEQTFDARPGD